VLVDDASTDCTAELARGFGDRVRVLRSERNLGPGGARNLAVDNALGELFATLDADDLFDAEYLATQVALYDREQAVDGRVGIVANNPRLAGPGVRDGETLIDQVGADAHGADLDGLLTENLIWCPIVPRAVFEEVGGYDPQLIGTEDHDLWLRIVESGYRVVATRRPLATYRLSSGSLMAQAELRAHYARRVYELALVRGTLNRRQRRIARKKRRLHALLERRAHIAAARRSGCTALMPRLRSLPATLVVALQHRERWRRWVAERGPRDPGPARRA
jgi:glycosyltransferase involved in cell wall biosynthesis